MIPWAWEIDGWIIAAGALSACACALLGNYLVLRRMSLMGDAISHAVLPGLAIAFIVTASRTAWPMFVGAVLAGVLTALLTQTIARYGKIEHGAAMGVAFSVLFAIGLLLIRQAADDVDLDAGCVLYGNLPGIGLEGGVSGMPQAVTNLLIVFGLDVAFVVFFYKELKIAAFDPTLATTVGVNATLMHYALMVMVAVTTVAAFESVGSILVIAMLIVPAAAAHLLTDRLHTMILVSLALAAISAVGGHVLAFCGPAWIGVDRIGSFETAPMIAAMTGVLFAGAALFSPRHGVLGRAYHRMALSTNIIREDILGLVYRWHEMRPEGQRPLHRDEIFTAVGDSTLARWALRSLTRRGDLLLTHAEAGAPPSVGLTPSGRGKAAHLVRAHRLWESYLARHFRLPLDHLHPPAEHMEHFISASLGEEIDGELTAPDRDPHGRAIPEGDASHGYEE